MNFLFTRISHAIIQITPKTTPITVLDMLVICMLSGIKSKHTIASISPDAKDNIKLKNLLEVFLMFTPIIPPIVVPNVPKNNPINVVFNK